ncbi:MAG TPA: polysaccharide biosynthesis C-terminal domain-containing protein [Ktedonobacteraceae bacterium]|jgi:O-antigen/teichoic acid export membrane protein|nr:polysaccharide biosynthesis C-terminal domain-containing protein [Ktedonobacteraceae bacterium]
MLLQRANTHAVLRPGIWRLSASACSALLSLFSTVLIARSLGPVEFGSYAFALWLATAAVPAIGLGMSARANQALADIQARQNAPTSAGLFYFVLQQQYRKILLYCLVYLLLVLLLVKVSGLSLSLLLLAGLSAPPLLLSGVASITLRGLRRFDLLGDIQLLGAAIMLLLVLLCMQYTFAGFTRLSLLLVTRASADILLLAFAMLCIARLLPLKEAQEPSRWLRERLTQGGRNSLPLFLLDAIVWRELLLVLFLGKGADLGYFALASLISTRVLLLFPALLSSCILPLLLRYVPGMHYLNAIDAWRRNTRYTALMAMPLCALGIYLCPTIITICFGASYLPMVTPLRLLLASAALGSVASISLTLLANAERKRAQAWLGIVSALLKLALILPFTHIWGLNGFALACAIAQAVSASGSIVLCRNYLYYRKKPV